MKKLRVNLKENSYDIIIDMGLLSRIKDYLPNSGKIFVVSNKTVFNIYGRYFSDFDNIILIPDGEKYKNLKTYAYIIDKLLEKNIQRNDTILALGGGVVGDITGFCASSVLRGVNYIQVPTTLLAQVDSSVGGKTGLDHKMGKNLIGAFYQPKLVLIDTNTLKTLDKRQFMAGLGEVIKYAFIENTIKENDDSFLFNYLMMISDLNNEDVISEIVYQACFLKALVVEKDEKEKGLRAVLNLGHTFGHAFEKISNYKILHGEGVVLGIQCAMRLAYSLGMINKSYFDDSFKLIERMNFNICYNKFSKDKVIEAFKSDKKVKFDKVRFILPNRKGSVELVQDIDNTLLKACLP